MRLALGLTMVLVGGLAYGQEQQKLPEAPVPVPAPERVPEPAAGDAVFAPLAVGSQPETLKLKYETYVLRTFGPRAIVSPAISAALRMARPPKEYPREWKDGAEAFGRNYGDALVRKVAGETGRFAVGALLHEDFRYRRAKTTNVAGRFFHALGYTLVDSSDKGHRMPAFANLAGAAAGSFVAVAYLPDGFNTNRQALQRTGTRMIGFGANNEFREFSPEIFRFFRKLHVPFPRLPVPPWYTRGFGPARPAPVVLQGPVVDSGGKPVLVRPEGKD